MNNNDYISKLKHLKNNPSEIDSYAQELVEVLCKYCKHNMSQREELLRNMKLTLHDLVTGRMFYVS